MERKDRRTRIGNTKVSRDKKKKKKGIHEEVFWKARGKTFSEG